MKKITLTLMMACIIAFSLNAQKASLNSLLDASKQNSVGLATENFKHSAEGKIVKQHNNSPKIISAFSEDFSDGALPTGWSTVANSGVAVWAFNNPGTRVINTTTAANGFAILDSDFLGSSNSQDADLISPTINCSALTTVKFSFEHYYYGYSNSTATVSLSVDNGSTWTPLGSWTTTSTANAIVSEYDISAAAAGQAQVKIKFNYVGTYAWYWAVDDIKVFQPETHDLTVTAISPNGFLVSGSTVAPIVTVKNVGATAEAAYAVTLKDGSAYNQTVNVSTSIAPGATYGVTFPNWTPADGDYTFTAYVVVASDGDVHNDTLIQDITVGPVEAYCANTTQLSYNKLDLISGAQSPVGTVSTSPFPMAEDFNGTSIYRIYNDLTIGTVGGDGTFTLLGTMTGVAGTPSAIAYNWNNDTWYVMVLSAANMPQLCTLNTSTLALTLIGAGTSVNMIIGMDFACDGYLYGPSISPDSLYKIDPTNGALTLIGPTGVNLNYGQDVSYDLATGKMYSSTCGAFYKFGTYNLSTGAFTPIYDNVSDQIATLVILKDPDPAANDILSFNFNGLTPAVSGTLDATNHTVAVTVPYGTDVTALVPTISVSCGATVSPLSGVAQNFSSPVTYTVTAQDGTSTQDWIVTVTVAAGIESINNENITIYPVPAKDIVNIRMKSVINQVEVISVTGQVISKVSFNHNEATLSTADFANGIYFIRIKTANGIAMKKIQVLK